jgi:hypothetical protein
LKNEPSPFDAIFAEDDPLLAVKSASQTSSSDDEIALEQFEAVNAFVDEHASTPGTTSGGREPDLNEYTLEGYLDAFQAEDRYCKLLAPHDRHGLLGARDALPTTMDEVLASDDALLNGPAEKIFALEHIAAAGSTKTGPDEIAKRRACEDFSKFKPVFAALSAELNNGQRYTKRFSSEGTIKEGAAFILNGILTYIANVEATQRRGKEIDARIRVIFGNGTESNHLLRSFARALYEDDNGRQILENAPSASGPLFTGADHVSGPLFTGELEAGGGSVTGSIYVVESLSTEPSIAQLRGRLYKIGFTTQDVDRRLADVETDPTFLLAPVRKVAVFDTIDLNPHKLEQLLHQFFSYAQLRVNVLLGRTVTPKEWFVVPIGHVREAVNRIIDGSIVRYRYDHISRKIVPR